MLSFKRRVVMMLHQEMVEGDTRCKRGPLPCCSGPLNPHKRCEQHPGCNTVRTHHHHHKLDSAPDSQERRATRPPSLEPRAAVQIRHEQESLEMWHEAQLRKEAARLLCVLCNPTCGRWRDKRDTRDTRLIHTLSKGGCDKLLATQGLDNNEIRYR